MLLPAEVLGRDWIAMDSAEVPPWPWVQPDCPTYRDADYAAQSHRLHASQRRYTNAATDQSALNIVETYEPGWAARAMADLHRVLRTCRSYQASGADISLRAVPTTNVCDETVTVHGQLRRPGKPPSTAYFVIVRCGDQVTTLEIPSLDDTDPAAHDLGRRLAARIRNRRGRPPRPTARSHLPAGSPTSWADILAS